MSMRHVPGERGTEGIFSSPSYRECADEAPPDRAPPPLEGPAAGGVGLAWRASRLRAIGHNPTV
jgi:hypothetical protein